VNWRTLALAACWLAAGGWGIYYLIVRASSSPAYVANAVAHFIVGYVVARAITTRPMSMPLALFTTLASGVYVRLAIAFGGPELFFTPLGLLAAAAVSDISTLRNIAYSVTAFALGYLLLIWLVP
jgi:hypothetical protein